MVGSTTTPAKGVISEELPTDLENADNGSYLRKHLGISPYVLKKSERLVGNSLEVLVEDLVVALESQRQCW